MKLLFNLSILLASSLTFGQLSGTWHTSFTIMGSSKRLDMNVDNNPFNPKITISNPDNDQVKNLAMDQVVLTDSTLSFVWTKTGISFSGNYNQLGDSIVGVMSQMDVKWGANFTRHEQEKVTVKRPQEPKAPFAYPVEELLLKNGDNTIGATLTLPLNAGDNYPIVVLASGSGAQDRNCEIMGHKPFLVIADYLARNGIGSIRFDDRGVGQSTGVFQQASLEDFASDVNTCVNFLVSDPRFAKNSIGVAGHSEGGMHVLIAAKKNKNIHFVIELASVGTSGREVLAAQNYLVQKKMGSTEEVAVWSKEAINGVCLIIAKNTAKDAIEPLNNYIDAKYETAPAEYKASTPLSQYKMGVVMLLNNDWGRQFIRFETANYLKKITVPVLAINGSQDIQVPAVESQAGFVQHFSKRSKANSKAIVVDGLNHLFQQCETCSIMEYGELEETFSEIVLKEMTTWIKGLK